MFERLNIVIKLVLSLTILAFFLSFSALWYFSSGLPDYKKLENYEPPISSRVYANDGTLIAEYALEKRLFIPYESIPKTIINSFLSAEDQNFF
jgi:penicillin-binding protein 1A